jgi:hypothetical protein
MVSGVGESMSVTKVGHRYVMVTQENNQVFSGWIVAYAASSPTGPFTGPAYLFKAPEPGIGNRPQFIYAARVHPELSPPGKLLISYDVNAWNGDDLLEDARIYRPRFEEVTWPPPAPDPSKAPGVPTALVVTGGGDGMAYLSWTAPGGGDLRYWVYRKDLSSGQTSFARTGHPTTDTRYGDALLKDGHTYAYQVTALNMGGYESAPSAAAIVVDALSTPAS